MIFLHETLCNRSRGYVKFCEKIVFYVSVRGLARNDIFKNSFSTFMPDIIISPVNPVQPIVLKIPLLITNVAIIKLE